MRVPLAQIEFAFCAARIGICVLVAGMCSAQDPEFAPRPTVSSVLAGAVSVETVDLDGDGDRDFLVATGSSGSILWIESDGDTNPGFPLVHVIDGTALNAAHASAADVDGDGDLDVLASVRSSSPSSVTWYENVGGLPAVFEPRQLGPLPPSDVGQRVNVARAADLDLDGDTDIVVGFHANAQSTLGHVVWYRSDGGANPSFTAVPLSAPSGAIENISDLRISDLNLSGSRDIVAVSETPGTTGGRNRVVWWSSTGGGNPVFQYQSIENTLIDPLALVVVNFTGTIAPDIAVVAAGSNRIAVLRNNGGVTPTFSTVAVIPLQDPRSLAAFDVEGDGDTDLAVALGTGSEVVVLENLGQATPAFTQRILGSDGGFCADLAVGDVSGNGRIDVAAVFPGTGRLDWFEQVRPIENLATGILSSTFTKAVDSAASGQTLLIPTERLKQDPIIDLNGKSLILASDDVFVLGQDASVLLANNASLSAASNRVIIIDGDVSAPSGSGYSLQGSSGATIRTSLSFTNGGDLTVGTDTTLDGPRELKRGVIDGDPALGSFFNLIGRPQDVLPITLSNGDKGIVVSGEEFGGTGQNVPSSLAVYAPDGSSNTQWTGYPIDTDVPTSRGAIVVGDFDSDGLEDIVSIRYDNGVPVLVLHTAQAGAIPAFASNPILTSIDAQHLVASDLDFDGDLDLVSGQGWFESSGGATPSFSYSPFAAVSGMQSFGLVVCDFDLDGGRDVAVHCELRDALGQSRIGYQLYVLKSDAGADPSFTPVLVQERDYVASGMCDGSYDCYPMLNVELQGLNTLSREDQNMDGMTDLFLSEDVGITLLTNLGTGAAFMSTLLTQDYAFDELLPTDLDGDHDVDLLVSSKRSSRVRFVENLSGTTYREDESIKPILRASGAAVLDSDSDGVAQLAIIATGHDRVEVIQRTDKPALDIISSTMDVDGILDVTNGTINVLDSLVDPADFMFIRSGGTLAGRGGVQADVYNGGMLRPDGTLNVLGSYYQYGPDSVKDTGTLQIDLRSDIPLDVDVLNVAQQATLAGGLIVQASPNYVPTEGNIAEILRANDFDSAGLNFDAVHSPRITVLQNGDPNTGTLWPTYNDGPPTSWVRLVATGVDDPPLNGRDFTAISTPADAVVFDITGGSNGQPDGYADTVIAYPEILGGAAGGGVAVFVGGPGGQGGFEFESLAIYTGALTAKPIAVEAGDYDGDGRFEVAVANSLVDTNQTSVFLLEVDSSLSMPVFESQTPPIFIRRGARILDMTSADTMPSQLTPGGLLRVGSPTGLVILSYAEDSGIATAAVMQGPGWETCDIDVCDDPDSVDPIDIDGGAAAYIVGFVATSNDDDKVVVASNPTNSPGMFESASYLVGDGPTEVRSDDLNNDGYPDIVTINENSGTVSVLLNISDPDSLSGRGFADQIELPLQLDLSDPAPLPSSVALADLDDDGDLDIAVVSTNAAGVRAVRRLTNQFLESGEMTFESVVDLDVQPIGVPLLVRETDFEGGFGGVLLNDDLVVFIDAQASPRPAPGFGPSGHQAIVSIADPFCLADTNSDGMLSPADFSAWVAAFNAASPSCDQNGDGMCSPADFSAWVTNYNAGCP